MLTRLVRIGWSPDDPEDQRLAKSVITLSSCLITLLSTVWVATYLALGLPRSAAIPLAYMVASVISLIALWRTKRLRSFRTTQLAMMLVLPFLLQLSLGGFVRSSGVILWSLIAPIGALMFLGTKRSLDWFVAYVALVAAAGLLEPFVRRFDVSVPAPVVVVFFVLNIVGVSATAFLLLRYFVGERERERAKSERLLRNVLPEPVAARLRDAAEPTIADAFDEVSVMFADIVGFTAMAADAAPARVVEILNGLFSCFDELADRHGLEKIKTIGDAYMVAGGIPVPRADHAEAVAEMALDVLEAMRRPVGVGLPTLQVRIGIATGPVVAGVIGTRKFIYDLWGDTVNTASRMESHGVAGEIQVTEPTYLRLRDRYTFRERGRVEVKGKGAMPTWLLLGRAVAAQTSP